MFNRKLLRFTPFATAILLSFPIATFASAGKAIFVIGKVNVLSEAGDEHRIKRGGEVNQGDTIVTNERSQIQIRMSDGTLLAVRPNSKFRVVDYVYEQDIDSDKSFYSLVKGGFRSITGSIGHENKSAYGVNTLVGTIGIRGTDFSARLCNSDCGDASDGLYVGVMQGGVVLSNDSGELDVVPGDFGYMQDQNVEPTQLETSPGDLLFAHTNAETQVADSTDTDASTAVKETTLTSSVENIEETNVAVAINTTKGDDLIIDVVDIIDPIDTSIALPTTGTGVYSVVNNTDPTDGITTGTLDTTKTLLTVNFVDPSATATVSANFNNTNWDGTTTQAMAIDSNGNFAGDLFVTAADASGFGSTQTGSGNLSGSLSGAAESTIGAPSDANMSYDMTTGSTTLTGDVTLGISNTSN